MKRITPDIPWTRAHDPGMKTSPDFLTLTFIAAQEAINEDLNGNWFLWRVTLGGSMATPVIVRVSAPTARRADQVAIAWMRSRWLNTKRTKQEDTRTIWIIRRQLYTPDEPKLPL